jgi:sugar (pentulose or hexulose) kinase
MSADLVVTIDAGTGSSRIFVYSLSRGSCEAMLSINMPIMHPSPYLAEFNPEQWWIQVRDGLRDAVRRVDRPAKDYLALIVTSLRQGFVLLDSSGSPVAPGVLNYDRRGANALDRIRAEMDIESLYRLTGHWHAPELTLPKLLWFQSERPDLWKKTSHMLFIHDWLLYSLCGAFGTNATLACAGQMADVRRRAWATEMLEAFSIRSGMLPPIFEAGEKLGGLNEETAAYAALIPGMPVHVGGGDTQFSSMGVGGMKEGVVVVVGGSTTPIMLTVDEPIFDERRFPWVSTHLDAKLWAIEMNAGHTGMIYKWFHDQFAHVAAGSSSDAALNAYRSLNEAARGAPLGSNGLRVIASSPRWAQDTWEAKAPYVIFDFSVSHSYGDVARAIMESVCFAVRGNVEQLERVSGGVIDSVLYTGGTAKSAFWAQMMADVLQRKLTVVQVEAAAAKAGAHLVGGRDAAIVEEAESTTAEYKPEVRSSGSYQEHYEHYLETFERLQQDFAQR